MQRTARVLTAVPLAVMLLSCGGGGDDPTAPPVDLTAVNTITVTAPALTLTAGKTLLLAAQATNVNGTVLPGKQFVWSTSSAAIATVEQNGMVLGVAPGTVDVAAAIGAKNGKVTLTVIAAPAATMAIAGGDGQSATVNSTVLVPPSVIVKDAAGEPVSGVTVTFAVASGGGTATGLTQTTNVAGIAAVGSWHMGPTAGPQTLTAASGTLAGSPVTFSATAEALPANMRQYNTTTSDGCNSIALRTGRVEAQSAHLTIVADISNPAGGFTQADYEAFAAEFESLVWPVLTGNFGEPTDINGDGRVVAFFTSAVNALTPPGSSSFVGGFFFVRDLVPKSGGFGVQSCLGSNETEMFYVLAPDPAGTLGIAHTTAFVQNAALGVIGHEMQHLINASRRLYVSETATALETLWMEEGLSHIAEELLFYAASGRSPRSNLTKDDMSGSTAAAASAHARANLARLSLYLREPSANSPYRPNSDHLETRGATWSLLRYLADRGSASTITGQACSLTSPITLSVNAACRIEGGSATQFSIDGGGGSEYAIVAFADGAQLAMAVSATNALAPSGPPNPTQIPLGAKLSQAPGGPTLDMSFHLGLRGRMERELDLRLPDARARLGQRHRGLARLPMGRSRAQSAFASITIEPVWERLVNAGPVGMANLETEFGANVRGNIRDWAVANYVDDAVTVAQAEYTHPSWDYRSVMTTMNLAPYAIQTSHLTSQQTHTIADGGAAYYRLGIAASTTSVLSFSVNAAPPPANLKLVLVRTK